MAKVPKRRSLDTRSKVGLLGHVRADENATRRADLKALLQEAFGSLSLQDLALMFTSEAQSALEYFDLQRGGRTCQRMSLLYNPHRLDVRVQERLSVYQALQVPGFANQIARLILVGGHKVRRASLLHALELGTYGVQYANEFPPHVARDLCLSFGVDRSSRVLDPCAGWGGRMIGVSVVADHYYGFEPATKTAKGLKRLSKTLAVYSPGFKGRIKRLPFEDSTLPDNWFDFALTSPPYFATERYSDEETQSFNRYPSFEAWCQGFYYPLIDKTMAALKPGGRFVLNIGSRQYPLNRELVRLSKVRGYTVEKLDKRFLAGNVGLGKSGEGETFYSVTKG